MNKQQAAEFLGVSVRALERYTQQGRISAQYQKGKTRPTVAYDENEIKEFKEELERTLHKPVVEPASNANVGNAANSETALAVLPDRSKLSVAPIFEHLLLTLDAQRKRPTVAIESKPLLKLDEASALTGLSREILRAAIDEGKLKAGKIGKAWRVRRGDLDTYIQKLTLKP